MQKNIGSYLIITFIIFAILSPAIASDEAEVRISATVSAAKVPLNHTVEYIVKVEWVGDFGKYRFTFPSAPERRPGGRHRVHLPPAIRRPA